MTFRARACARSEGRPCFNRLLVSLPRTSTPEPMDTPATITRLERQIRQLRAAVALCACGLVLLLASAFRAPTQDGRFKVLDVERLNVRAANGNYVVVIANPDLMPGNVMGGKEHSGGRRGGGLLFYNAQGDEAGGLIFDSERKDTALVNAFGQLSLDRFQSDQVVALRYLEDPQGWSAGLQVSHFVRDALVEWHLARDSILELPAARQDSALRALRRRFFRAGKWEIPRVFVGERGKTALLGMNDMRGRQRIRMVVDSLDAARLEFLNDSGRVVHRVP